MSTAALHMPPSKLSTLDLFSGIGGLTLALEGIAVPLVYCDAAPGPQRVIRARIADRSLPAAPICSDIRKLNKQWVQSHVQRRRTPNAIVAGFPCVGFSTAGHREGFKNHQSALFFEMLRVLDEFDINIVFMENVPGILSGGMTILKDEMSIKRGFQLRWCVLSACDVGAPQRRSRWYCVAVRRDAHIPKFSANTSYSHDWSNEPTRMTLSPGPYHFERHFMLGNAVVPKAARQAFANLIKPLTGKHVTSRKFPRTGIIEPNGNILVTKIHRLPVIPRQIVLIPSAYLHSVRPSKQLTTGLVTEPVVIEFWGTPTTSSRGMANYLTNKCKKLLHTQVRFEQYTPDNLRAGKVTPEFVEWLMGFPHGWTL